MINHRPFDKFIKIRSGFTCSACGKWHDNIKFYQLNPEGKIIIRQCEYHYWTKCPITGKKIYMRITQE